LLEAKKINEPGIIKNSPGWIRFLLFWAFFYRNLYYISMFNVFLGVIGVFYLKGFLFEKKALHLFTQ